MNIETKFEVNNLLLHKFTNTKNANITALEVIFVNTETCSAGTQVFYMCRPILVMTKKDWEEGKAIFKKIVEHAVGQRDFEGCWHKYREDELIAAPQDVIDLVLSGGQL